MNHINMSGTKKKLSLLILVVLLLIVAGLRIRRDLWSAVKPIIIATNKEELAAIPKATDEERLVSNSEIATKIPLKLPANFIIRIYAENLISPRVLLFTATGTLLTSLTNAGQVVAVLDNDDDGFAETNKELIKGLNRPHGLALKDGWLYIAETDKVVRYLYDEKQTALSLPGEKILDLPVAGGGHYTRTLGFGPDNKLYVSVGSSCNVCLEKDKNRAVILRANLDGSQSEIYASGLRNSVFFAWQPITKELYATEMGRDYLGNDLPPDEINIIHAGRNYGWPFCYGQKVYDKVFRGVNNCQFSEPSLIDLPAHVAPLGIVFLPLSWVRDTGQDLLIAYHGSWNSSVPVGYEVAAYSFNDQSLSSFISGWLAVGGASLGRPVDLIFDDQDRLYLSDDKAGVIYQIIKL